MFCAFGDAAFESERLDLGSDVVGVDELGVAEGGGGEAEEVVDFL